VAGALRFVKVAALADLPAGASLAVRISDTPVALFNVGGSVYAIDNICPHAGGPLARGALGGPDGAIVTCPLHGWRFDVRTGQSPHLRGEQLRTFLVRVVDGAIEVEAGDRVD
jgi:NAD(P)H-dependent nitrite reductase small subunit